MGYFNTNIDNDITYLLQEIGHNCKVNNIPAKAIVNNASMERTFDDKKIITHEELKRGYYAEYNNLFFIVLNEVNDKRYNTYYKGVMRRCNFDLKFIINDKLYLFPIIAEGDKFFINGDSTISFSADTISVTIPLTPTTRQIKREDNFIKWGQKWEVQGLDYTKDGLIVLTCKANVISDVTDDKVNEIADRWIEIDGEKIDRLNGNITPILPFDEEPEEPIDPEEPEEPEPTEPTEGITYTITSIDAYDKTDVVEIWANSWAKFTVHKFIDDVEVSGVFTFEIDNTSFVTILEQTNNTIKIKANDTVRNKDFTLTIRDTETDKIVEEIYITIIGY